MAQTLSRLRMDLDFMPSPVEDRPGLLIRDSYGFSDVTLIVPPPVVPCLECFDGEQTDLDLRRRLVEITGELDVGEFQTHLTESLSNAGFLVDEVYARLRETRRREFAEAGVRHPAHAGSAYPDDRAEVREVLNEYLAGSQPDTNGNLIGIAAPHVSPFGGWQTYREAFGLLSESYRDRTFVVLGTSHYGEPNRYGLTRKPFVTPYGQTRVDLSIVDELADEPAVAMEDYCHAVEHSIEFQVLFLQHLFGADIKIAPVLCGSLLGLPKPDENEAVRRFVGKLGDIHASRKDLLWVLGIDMAHMGMRYGDSFEASADAGEMVHVAERDRFRIDRVNKGDASGFWDLVQENGDDLKWCGSAPLYTFMKAVPEARGKLHRYEQWNIDETSVVSFAAISFR